METKLRNQIRTFFVLLTLLTAVVFALMFSTNPKNMAWGILSMFTPCIAAITTSLIHKEKFKNYGWKFGKAKYLAYAFLVPALIAVIAYGISWILGLTDFFTEGVANYKWSRMIGLDTPAPIWIGILSKTILGSIMFGPFILAEEIGWSGFLTPKLLKLTSIPKTSLIVGLYWALWHYPAIIGGVYGYGTPLWISLPGFTLVILGLSFFRSYFVSKSKSLWTGVLLHISQNLVLVGIFYDFTVKTKTAAYFVSETGIITGVTAIVVAILFWKFIKKHRP